MEGGGEGEEKGEREEGGNGGDGERGGAGAAQDSLDRVDDEHHVVDSDARLRDVGGQNDLSKFQERTSSHRTVVVYRGLLWPFLRAKAPFKRNNSEALSPLSNASAVLCKWLGWERNLTKPW